jgi:hypothetical protein
VYHGLQESVPRLFYKPTSNKINDRFDVICRHSNGALMTTSILSLYTQHDSDFIFRTTRFHPLWSCSMLRHRLRRNVLFQRYSNNTVIVRFP